jgi:hypothetical protein
MLCSAIQSCSKDSVEFDDKGYSQSANNKLNLRSQPIEYDTLMVLGNQLPNPYTLANMTLAFNSLYGTSLSTIAATHRYIKFLPDSAVQIGILDDWELNEEVAVFMFPMDYEILVDGNYYVDPAVMDTALTYRYASVPVGTTLPNVPNQILGELFIPPYSSYLTEKAYHQVGMEWVGNTTRHPDWSIPTDQNGNWSEGANDPDFEDDCTPSCSNYPCCKFGWNDCDEYACTSEYLTPPCMPGDPGWPECLDVNNPSGNDPPPGGGGPTGGIKYCECTEYVNGNPIRTWKVNIFVDEGESCVDFEEEYSTSHWIDCSGPFDPPASPTVYNECGCPIPKNRRVPAGCIKVDGSDGYEPVVNVLVKIKNYLFSSAVLFTNSSGCWKHNKEYHGRMWTRVKFMNSDAKVRAFREKYVWNALLILRDPGKEYGPYFNDIRTYYQKSEADNQSRSRMYWAAAHSINSDGEYRSLSAADGIPGPGMGLNYLLTHGSGTGGAPMMQNIAYGSWLSLLKAIGLQHTGIPPLFRSKYPDIFITYSSTTSSNRHKTTIFHELGHSSHYQLVGENYWVPYRNHIINNFLASGDVYGSFNNFASGSDPDRVALGEAFGYYVGAKYGTTSAYGGEGNQFLNNFIPTGLLHDLNDDVQDLVIDPNNSANQMLDIISDFTPMMFYNSLVPNVNSIRDFREVLRDNFIGSTSNNSTDFNNFLDVYDVFN